VGQGLHVEPLLKERFIKDSAALDPNEPEAESRSFLEIGKAFEEWARKTGAEGITSKHAFGEAKWHHNWNQHFSCVLTLLRAIMNDLATGKFDMICGAWGLFLPLPSYQQQVS
jgi:hypothetical protein